MEKTKATIIENILRHPDLPSPSATAMEVIKLASKEETTLAEISSVIGKDPSLSGKVLRYSNSAASRGFKPTTVISDAVRRIGLVAVKHIALGLSLVSSGKNIPKEFQSNAFWLSSLATGYAAKAVSTKLKLTVAPDEAFTIGLLLPIGKLAMACSLKDEYIRTSDDVLNDDVENEIQVLGCAWNDVSVAMMTKWGFDRNTLGLISMLQDKEQDSDSKTLKNLRMARELALKIYKDEEISFPQIDDEILEEVVQEIREALLKHKDDFPDQPTNGTNTNKTISFGMGGKIDSKDFNDPEAFLRAIFSEIPKQIVISDSPNATWIARTCMTLKKMESTKRIPIRIINPKESTIKALEGVPIEFVKN